MAPPSRHGDTRGTGREDILAVASRLFMTRGYRAVSTRDIAQEVGLTQPAIYHHFAGKEDLYVAVVLDQVADYAQAIGEAARTEGTAADRLEAVATAIAMRADHDLALMFHDLRFEISAEARRTVGTAFAQGMVAPIAAVLEGLVREGRIAKAEVGGLTAHEQAMYLLGVIRTMTDRGAGARAGPSRTPDQMGAIIRRLVLHGLSPPGRDARADKGSAPA